ncbi:hypothetical protein GOB98_10515 [Sinorhizobium meliloti]|nr:hypothetical protein [Sinorhizobium meliloti]MDW9976522.1 hypothetical protein [Sinorhizobium meliloti]MDX0293244.1 hypothetical protein [Sinorhizobium meliloti]
MSLTSDNFGSSARQRFIDGQLVLRDKLVRRAEQQILVAHLIGSHQAEDEYSYVNCEGVGRERVYTSFQLHFDERQRPGPAAARFGRLETGRPIRTQVFQVAGCDLRCWYCFVDFQLLSGLNNRGRWLTAQDLFELMKSSGEYPPVIELSGGQVELVPEWTLWMMRELERLRLDGEIAVWSDDNLTSDFFWRFLSPTEQSYVKSFPRYSRAVCLKGFDEESFEVNTGFPGEIFLRQIEILNRLISEDFPLVIYLTVVDKARPDEVVEAKMASFAQILEAIRPGLSRDVIPLRMASFRNMMRRANSHRLEMFGLQRARFCAWQKTVETHFAGS